jgi:hypothetical protein
MRTLLDVAEWVIADRVKPVASPPESITPPKADVRVLGA